MSDRNDPRASGRSPRQRPLSYKFQRLREQIRSAVLNGEFQGRLPGERELGRLYNANAKTINKALSDLSAEGLLVRRIGKGTFVAQHQGDASKRLAARNIHVVAKAAENGDRQQTQQVLELLAARLRDRGHDVCVRSLRLVNGELHVPDETMREADVVIWVTLDLFSGHEAKLKNADALELMRRQIPIVAIGVHGDGPRRNAVTPDFVDAGFRMTQHLILSGRDRLAILSTPEAGREFELLYQGCRTAAARYGRTVEHLSLVKEDDGYHLPDWQSLFGPEASAGVSNRQVGLICAGRYAVMSLVDENAGGGPAVLRRVAPVCIVEPAKSICQQFDLTAYEITMGDLVDQAAHLAGNARAGDMPVEVLVPGKLELRGSLSAARRALSDADAELRESSCI